MIRWPIRMFFGIALYQMTVEGAAAQEDGFWFAAVMFLGTFLFGGGGKSEEEKAKNQKEEKVENQKEEKKMGLFSKIAAGVVAYNVSKQPIVHTDTPDAEVLGCNRIGATKFKCLYKVKGKKGSFEFNNFCNSMSAGGAQFKVEWNH